MLRVALREPDAKSDFSMSVMCMSGGYRARCIRATWLMGSGTGLATGPAHPYGWPGIGPRRVVDAAGSAGRAISVRT
jgi:hypothetical protein